MVKGVRMANNIELLSQLALRADSSTGWSSENPVLIKGEPGFDTTVGKLKIGDGITAWNSLPFIGGTEANHYEVTGTEAGDIADITTAVGATELHDGDTAVVKHTIADDKLSYTAYVYENGAWHAMDGNYSADNVYFNDDLTYTANIGVKTVPSSGSGTISAKGKNVKQVLADILALEKNPKTTQPSISLNSSNIGAKEVGTRIAIAYSFSSNPGSYTYGPNTGVTFSNYSATFGEETVTGANGTFTEIQVGDNTNLTISGTASHTAGAIPKTNIGNDYAAGQIQAGTKSASKGALTGFRNMFYGTLTTKDELTSAVIRSLTGKKATATGNISVSIPTGALRVVVAVPSNRTVSKVLDVNGLNANITGAFTKTTVSVEGANGYTAKEYNVYYTDYAAANDKANTYTVTIG